MEKFFDKIGLVLSGIGIAFSYGAISAGFYITGGVTALVSLLLFYAGMTEDKKRK